MTKITIINSKGGVGKTTIALNLGLFYAKTHAVSFIDLDPQQSLSDLIKRRPKSLKQFQCIKSSCNKLNNQFFNSSEKNPLYIIDSPASVEQSNLSSLFICAVRIIPVFFCPTVFSEENFVLR